jgi:hypothetical protein
MLNLKEGRTHMADTATPDDRLIVSVTAGLFDFYHAFADLEPNPHPKAAVLSSLCLAPGEAQVWATDGYKAGAMNVTVEHCADTAPVRVIVPGVVVEDARALHTWRKALVRICLDATGQGRVEVSGNSGIVSIPFTPGDAEYPEVGRLMRSPEDLDARLLAGVLFNPNLLGLIARFAGNHGSSNDEDSIGTLWLGIHDDVLEGNGGRFGGVEFGGHDWRGILMPMIPHWEQENPRLGFQRLRPAAFAADEVAS